MKYLEKYFGENGILTRDSSISANVLIIAAGGFLLLVFSFATL